MKNLIFCFVVALLLFASTSTFVAQGQSSAYQVADTISVGRAPIGIAFNPRNGYLYVTNESDATVSVINAATNTVVAIVPVGLSPRAVTYNARNGDMYVSNTFSDQVVIIDEVKNYVTTTIPVPVDQGCFHPFAMAYDPRNARMYVDCLSYTSVAVINTTDNTIEGLVEVGSSPEGIVFSPRDGDVYVANDHNGNISVIDPAKNMVITSIDLPPIWLGESIELGYNPRNNYLYATISEADAVVVVNATTKQVVTTLSVGDTPLGVAFNSRDGNMYVANYGDGTVSVIDSQTSSVVATIPVGQGPQWLAFNPHNGNLYVTNSISNTVSVISIKH